MYVPDFRISTLFIWISWTFISCISCRSITDSLFSIRFRQYALFRTQVRIIRNCLEDEFHFLIECPLYHELWKTYKYNECIYVSLLTVYREAFLPFVLWNKLLKLLNSLNVAISDHVGSRLVQFEAQFIVTINDIVCCRLGQFKGTFAVALRDQVGSR